MSSLLGSVLFFVSFQCKKEQEKINRLKSKLRQVSVIALPDWQLLH